MSPAILRPIGRSQSHPDADNQSFASCLVKLGLDNCWRVDCSKIWQYYCKHGLQSSQGAHAVADMSTLAFGRDHWLESGDRSACWSI